MKSSASVRAAKAPSHDRESYEACGLRQAAEMLGRGRLFDPVPRIQHEDAGAPEFA